MSDNAITIDAPIAHDSLQRPSLSRRSVRGFSEVTNASDDARSSRGPRRPRGGLAAFTAEVAENAGPIGGLLSAGIGALGGGSNDADPRTEQLDAMWEMQRESQDFNMEYLALQESMQSENRRFSTLSNLMKARHDTAKAAVSNIRV